MGEKGSIFPAIQDLFKPSLQLTAQTKSAQRLTLLWHVRMIASALIGPAILYVLLSNIEPIPDEDRIPLAMNGPQRVPKATSSGNSDPKPPKLATADDSTDTSVIGGALVNGNIRAEFEQLAKKMEQLQHRLDELGLLLPSRSKADGISEDVTDATNSTDSNEQHIDSISSIYTTRRYLELMELCL
eukprot:m.175912 g.175912  ORF g.175912 m.175912 type:complete len:186 (-) comp31835_c1_seq1:41-598(-)